MDTGDNLNANGFRCDILISIKHNYFLFNMTNLPSKSLVMEPENSTSVISKPTIRHQPEPNTSSPYSHAIFLSFFLILSYKFLLIQRNFPLRSQCISLVALCTAESNLYSLHEQYYNSWSSFVM